MEFVDAIFDAGFVLGLFVGFVLGGFGMLCWAASVPPRRLPRSLYGD